jgi:sec-independent protein translocase protein TatC
VIAAIVTPPDIVSQFSLAIPMWLLFEIGVILSPMFVKATTAPEEKAD